MNQQQPGFSVIEFVISIMISAMLMTAALTIYHQISKSMTTIQTLTQQDITATIVQNRLSQDLAGLCTVWFTADQLKQPTNSQQQDPKQPAQQKTIQTTPENPNMQKNNYLYAQSKDKQLNYLTFVTTSTLQTYVNPQHRCARVVYALEKDTKYPNLFILRRKEEPKISNEFNKETITTQGDFYTLAKNISKCTFEYGFIDTPPQQRQQQPDKEWKIKWVDNWGISNDMKQSNDYSPTLPDIMRITIAIQENSEKQGKEYEFYCLLVQSKEATFQSFTQKRYYEQRNAKQSPTPPGQGANSGGTPPGPGTNPGNTPPEPSVDNRTIIEVIPKGIVRTL